MTATLTTARTPLPAGSLGKNIAVAGGISTVVAVAGALLTDIGPWYQSLRQPTWKPPDLAFGPAWTTIFTLATASAVIAWRRAPDRETRLRILRAYLANGVLNAGWSALYFTAKRPDWSLAETVPLWLSIVHMMRVSGRCSPKAAALLAPYLLWVSFAAALNLETVRLNGPFGER